MTTLDKAKVGNDQVAFIRNQGQVVWPQYARHENLVVWYDSMGKTNSDLGRGVLEDLSGNGNHGTLQNFEYTDESGYDDGLVFDGVDDYTISDSKTNLVTGDFTFHLVIRPASTGVTANRGGLAWFDYQQYFGFSVYYQSNPVSGGAFFFIYSTDGASRSTSTILSPTPLEGTYILTVCYNKINKTIEAYVDGALTRRANLTNDLVLAGESPISLGRWSPLYPNYQYKGDIYSASIFNRYLTPSEVMQNYLIDKSRWVDSYDPSTVAVLNYADKMGYERSSKQYIDKKNKKKMKFSIATIVFWNNVGFDTEHWRKSTDETKAICHSKFAESLVDLANPNVLTLDIDTQEFKDLIRDEFTSNEEE